MNQTKTPAGPHDMSTVWRDILNWPLSVLILVGIALAGLSVWAQPRIGDDWNNAWMLANAGSLWRYVEGLYFGSGGRILSFTLIGIALSSEAATQTFRLLSVGCFLTFSLSVFYLANSAIPKIGSAARNQLLLATAVLWLGLPVVSDTMVHLAGACAYLWPATVGLVFLCLFRRARDQARRGASAYGSWRAKAGWLVAGVVVGTGNEQLFAGMAVVLAGWGWMLWREGRLRHLPPEAWWGFVGLLVGTLILVAAPGNYARLDAESWRSGGLSSILSRYVLYVGGAYFALGTGDAGRSLWLGIAVIALSGVFTPRGDRGKDACVWMAGSVATLAPMLPLVNVASPRTTFLAATFLVIAVLTAFPRAPDSAKPAWPASLLVAYGMAMLVVVDGLAGWVANRSLAREMAFRAKLLQVAAAERRRQAVVPYIATAPSRLTYMLNPEHDAEFLVKLSRSYGLEGATHDDSAGAPRPYSLNSLKALKKSL